MNGDTFINNDGKGYGNSLNEGDNFFMQKDSFQSVNSYRNRLNGYDLNILEDEAYKEINDDLFKLEYKISKCEEKLNDIKSKVQSARDIDDFEQAGSLSAEQEILEAELNELKYEYGKASISANISGYISNVNKKKENIISIFVNLFRKSFLYKFSPKIASAFEFKQSLHRLESINKSVNELMELSIPYGEENKRYEQLSKYIAKANNIQAEMSNIIRKRK